MTPEEKKRIDELVDKAQAGDRQAFSEITKLLMNPTYSLTYKLTGDKEAAKDLAQESLIAAWTNLAGFKKEARFESWLYRIATNKTLNHLRKRKEYSNEDISEEPVATNSPGRELEQKELREEFVSFMKSLPAQQRLVFELHFYKELTFEEVAGMTGKALGTVKTLYREAVLKLREVALQKGWQYEL